MTTAELRIYQIRPGLMAEFVARFHSDIAPARRAHGFEIIGPWVDDAAHTFVWIARHEGGLAWHEAVAAYYDSPERREIGFDPMDFIQGVEARLLDDV